VSRAVCAPENHPPVDLAEIDGNSSAAAVAGGRALCASCPLLVRCRQTALKVTDMAGMAGGMTEAERTAWRAAHKVVVHVPDIVDVTPARALSGAVLDDLPVLDSGELHPRVKEVIVRMTLAGMTADDIVTRLNRDDVTHRTVNYIRRTYMKGYARVDA
jgi:hypothetical protein